MKRFLLSAAILLVSALPALAQRNAIGIQIGAGQMAKFSDIDLGEFDDEVKEIFVSTELEPGTILKLKAGQVETDDGLRIGAPGITDEGKIEYVDAVVEYRFWEVFGSTTLFAGGGAYRQRFGSFEETDFGATAGVNALFPMTRRTGILGELAYHWMNFENNRRMLVGSIGLRVGF
jgi:hypothetical protein